MNEVQDKKPRPRSPEFPYISLPEAIARVEQLITAYQRHPARIKNVAPLWDYKPSSSSFLRNVAALRSFGLVDETGSGDDRKIAVSDLGMRITSDKRPGAKEAAIKKAFDSCTILSDYRQQWGKRRPPDTECLSELTLDRGFGDDAARKFLSVYDESVAFSESVQDGGSPEDEVPPTPKELPELDVGMYVQWEQNGILQLEQPGKLVGFSADGKYAFVEGATAGIPRAELIPADAPVVDSSAALQKPARLGRAGAKMIEATYPVAEGTCTLIYPAEISEKSAKRLKRWLDLMLEDVSEIAGLSTPGSGQSED